MHQESGYESSKGRTFSQIHQEDGNNAVSVKKCAVGITKLYEIIVNDEKPVQACVITKYNGISKISFSFRVSKCFFGYNATGLSVTTKYG